MYLQCKESCLGQLHHVSYIKAYMEHESHQFVFGSEKIDRRDGMPKKQSVSSVQRRGVVGELTLKNSISNERHFLQFFCTLCFLLLGLFVAV